MEKKNPTCFDVYSLLSKQVGDLFKVRPFSNCCKNFGWKCKVIKERRTWNENEPVINFALTYFEL